MKKFKKIMTIGLAAMAAVSAMSISAMAKETMDLGNGITLEMYNSAVDEITDVPVATDIDNFNFDLIVPKYPSFVYLTSTSGVRNLVLDPGQSVIQAKFDELGCFQYFSLYDVTAGNYLSGSSSSMVCLPNIANDVFRWDGLPGGHTYRIALAHTYRKTDVTGYVISY